MQYPVIFLYYFCDKEGKINYEGNMMNIILLYSRNAFSEHYCKPRIQIMMLFPTIAQLHLCIFWGWSWADQQTSCIYSQDKMYSHYLLLLCDWWNQEFRTDHKLCHVHCNNFERSLKLDSHLREACFASCFGHILSLLQFLSLELLSLPICKEEQSKDEEAQRFRDFLEVWEGPKLIL